jgi:hypothetical protein
VQRIGQVEDTGDRLLLRSRRHRQLDRAQARRARGGLRRAVERPGEADMELVAHQELAQVGGLVRVGPQHQPFVRRDRCALCRFDDHPGASRRRQRTRDQHVAGHDAAHAPRQIGWAAGRGLAARERGEIV